MTTPLLGVFASSQHNPPHTFEENRERKHMARTSKPKEIVVVGSKIKDVIKEAGLRSDGELVQAVSDKVHDLLADAVERCQKNSRSTVRPYDL